MSASLQERLDQLVFLSDDRRVIAELCGIVVELNRKVDAVQRELEQAKQHCSTNDSQLSKRIDRLNGVHGA